MRSHFIRESLDNRVCLVKLLIWIWKKVIRVSNDKRVSFGVNFHFWVKKLNSGEWRIKSVKTKSGLKHGINMVWCQRFHFMFWHKVASVVSKIQWKSHLCQGDCWTHVSEFTQMNFIMGGSTIFLRKINGKIYCFLSFH